MTVEELDDCFRLSATSDDAGTTTYEVKNELRPINNATFANTSKNNTTLFEQITIINGTEYKLPAVMPAPTQSTDPSTPLHIPQQTTRGDYMWDGIEFEAASYQVKYPRPDRDAHQVPTWKTMYLTGSNLYHIQFGTDDVSGLLTGTWGPIICVALGALIGLVIATYFRISNAYAAFASAALGALFGGILQWQITTNCIDKEGCIWVWIGQDFIDWLESNEGWLFFAGSPALELLLEYELFTRGYVRVADMTFVDAYGIGNPVPPPTPTLTGYASSVVTDQSSIYGGSYVNYPWNMQGESGDGQLGYMYSGSGKDGKATVIATMYNKAAGNFNAQIGHVYLNATGMSYGSRLMVFGSMSSSGGWFSIANQLVSNTSPNYVFCGYVDGSFKYLAIVAYNSDGTASYLNIDSIEVWNWL